MGKVMNRDGTGVGRTYHTKNAVTKMIENVRNDKDDREEIKNSNFTPNISKILLRVLKHTIFLK